MSYLFILMSLFFYFTSHLHLEYPWWSRPQSQARSSFWMVLVIATIQRTFWLLFPGDVMQTCWSSALMSVLHLRTGISCREAHGQRCLLSMQWYTMNRVSNYWGYKTFFFFASQNAWKIWSLSWAAVKRTDSCETQIFYFFKVALSTNSLKETHIQDMLSQ